MSDTVVFLVLVGALAMLAAGIRHWWQVAAGAMAVQVAQGNPRFARALQRFGIDLAALESERALREAAIGAGNCSACPDQEACDAWLAGDGRKGPPPYCPNEPFLRGLSRR